MIGSSLGAAGAGWIVCVLGLKVSIAFYALPRVGLGVFQRFLARGR